MNRIVREHYPVSKLPEELREGFGADVTVTVVVEEESTARDRQLANARTSKFVAIDLTYREPGPEIPLEELLESIRVYKTARPSLNDPDEPVRRIRALRDEWDDE